MRIERMDDDLVVHDWIDTGQLVVVEATADGWVCGVPDSEMSISIGGLRSVAVRVTESGELAEYNGEKKHYLIPYSVIQNVTGLRFAKSYKEKPL